MGEVETELSIGNIRSLLLNMGSEDLAQSLIEEVCTGVIVRNFLTALCVYYEGEACIAVLGEFLRDMDCKAVFLDGVEDIDPFAGGLDISGISYLAAHLSVERSFVEDELEHLLVLLNNGTLPEEFGSLDSRIVIADEKRVSFRILYPVAEFVCGSVAGALFLLLELYIEAVQVYCIAVLACDQLGKVDRETVGIVEDKCVYSSSLIPRSRVRRNASSSSRMTDSIIFCWALISG